MQGSAEKETPLLRVYHDATDLINLATLPDQHQHLAHIETGNPRILRLANFYVVYDGTHTLARVPFLADALHVWCLHVDAHVEKQLHKIGITGDAIAKKEGSIGASARTNMIKVLEYAGRIVQSIPPLLRKCYSLDRDPVTLQRTRMLSPTETLWYPPDLARQFRRFELWPKENIQRRNSFPPRTASNRDDEHHANSYLQW
jgi:hypothetical protein